MTPQRRGVRFSVNSERTQQEPAPSVPLPPPSPPPKERVLHSIFSPSYGRKANNDFHSPPRASYAASSEEGPTIVGATLSTQPNNLSPISAISAFTAGTSHWQQEKTQRFKIASVSSDALNTSVDTLSTIEMLNFKFIRSCDSKERLERILKVLNHTKKDSPLLLQETKERLAVLTKNQNQQSTFQKISGEETGFESPGKDYFHSYAANISRITNGNSTLDSIDPTKDGSLNLTLSPQSVLQGVDFVDSPSAEERKLFSMPQSTNYAPTPTEDKVVGRHLSPIDEQNGGGKVKPSVPPPPPPRESHKRKTDIQGSFLQKLQNLEEAKKNAEKVVEGLQTKVQKANNDTKHMIGVVEAMKKEKEMQQEEMERERRTFEQEQFKASTVERDLQKRVSSLIAQLRETEEKSRLVMGAEKAIRVKTEKQLSKVQQNNKELNAMLEKAKQNLESMKQRQANFRMELFRCMGLSIDEWRNSSSRDLLAELSKKIETLSEENRNAKVAIQSGLKMAEERDRLETQLKKTIEEKNKLQEENSKLSDRIQDLAQEVESSRVYIDRLLTTSHAANEDGWEAREEKYKTAIQNLRQQIRKQGSTVKLELYKSALDDAKKKSQDLHEANKKIADLVDKVADLQKIDKSSSPHGPLSSPEGKQAVRRVAASPTEYLNGELNLRSLGKPIRHATFPEQTNEEHVIKPIPFTIDRSYEKIEAKTPVARKKTQSKTPKSHDKTVSILSHHKSPDYQNAWTKRRNKDDLLGFEVLVPIDAVQQQMEATPQQQQSTNRFRDDDFNVWNDTKDASPNSRPKASNYPSRNKFVFKHLTRGNTSKSPLLARKERRERQEEEEKRRRMADTENVDPVKDDAAPVSSPRKPSTPRELARKAGGRKALVEKVRKMRSPASKVRAPAVNRVR